MYRFVPVTLLLSFARAFDATAAMDSSAQIGQSATGRVSRPAAGQTQTTPKKVAPSNPAPIDVWRPAVHDQDVGNLGEQLEQLKVDRQALEAMRESAQGELELGEESVTSLNNQLRQQLKDLVSELANRRRSDEQSSTHGVPISSEKKTGNTRRSDQAKKIAKVSGGMIKPNPRIEVGQIAQGKPIDALALAQALFRTGDYSGALVSFRLVDQVTLKPEDRTAIKYFTAACLRRSGNIQEATALFREVANSKDDEIFADCAQWQLSTLQWRNELETMIERLRRQREELNPPASAQKDGVDRSTKLDSEPETL